MKKNILTAAVAMVLAATAQAGGGTHWGYSGDEGPEHWGSLSDKNRSCSEGRNQSPIDLTGFTEADLPPIGFAYTAGGNEVINNGHTVQVNFTAGSRIQVDGRDFELKQYHFHAPSENHIDGRSYPLEAHLVHADSDGNLAVVAVMFEEGAANAGLDAPWAVMPESAGGKEPLTPAVSADAILPSDRDYYRFSGSLTTPPCSEGVRWLVLKEPVSASKAQVEKFSHLIHHPNNRSVQPLNARLILQ